MTDDSLHRPGVRLAVLDVDGTLLPQSPGAELPGRLAAARLVRDDGWQALSDFLSTLPEGALEQSATAATAYSLFGAMLKGASAAAVEQVTARLWASRRDQVFAFAHPLVQTLRARGFVPALVSVGPHGLVAALARELGIALYRGTRLDVATGRCTGRVQDVAGRKPEVAEELVAEAGDGTVDWPGSLAIGNSLADARLLERVGTPLAFEPTPALRSRAQARGWPVVDRTTLLPRLRRPGLRPATRPERNLDDGPAAGARARLVEHVSRQVGADGAVAGRCRSRVIESALMLELLRREDAEPLARRNLTGFLTRAASAPAAGPTGEFDTALVAAVLDGRPVREPAALIRRVLEGFEHGTSARKTAALHAILAVTGAAPWPRPLTVPHDTATEAGWTRLLLAALAVLAEPHAPAPSSPAATRLLGLLESRPDAVWEQNVLAHLVALLAVHRIRPGHPVVRRGIAALLACRNTDGGLPFIAAEEVFCTATAGLALARSGAADPALLRTMGDQLAGLQAPAGGWGYARGVTQTDADDTAYAMQFLHTLDPARYREPLTRARAHLATLPGPDGGVPTFLPGGPSEAAMTAATITALAPYHRHHRELLTRATAHLLSAQHPDGTYERSWSLAEANAVFRAHLALRTAQRLNTGPANRTAEAIRRTHERLIRTQHPDGGWGHTPERPSDATSTAYSLIALADSGHTTACARAVAHLVERQDPDGGFTDITDQAAPRPLPYAVPVLTGNFVLLALSCMP
ncbi:haloacid dehalogenase-like hydrolase [Kitasatospora sp. NPDC097605]|uniref:haloacid dehalogenase-like hydrolase n=1 Tax=Kitasatospora sp. NPDC097605 TaxID=3157226 RepID=UPI003332E252